MIVRGITTFEPAIGCTLSEQVALAAEPDTPLRRAIWLHLGTPSLLRAVDVLILLLASVVALWARFERIDHFSPLGPYAILIGLLLAANILPLFRVYRPAMLFGIPAMLRAAAAWGMVILMLIAIGYAAGTAADISRIWVALWFGFGVVGLVGWRAICLWLNDGSVAAAGPPRSIAVLGSGPLAAKMVGELRQNADRRCRLFGLFGEPDAVAIPGGSGGRSVDDLIAHCRARRVDEIVIAADGSDPERLKSWILRLRQLPVDIAILPAVTEDVAPLREIRQVGSLQVISIAERPLGGSKGLWKRVLDIVTAGFVIVLTAPLMALIAIAIKLDSRGPVFFRQTRYGFNDELIEVLKFRTMRVDQPAEETVELLQASRADPRVTRVGRVLRRSSLDELPQFLQALTGSMSVVGPRPHAVAHHHKYSRLIHSYQARHRVKPGITGWAQVQGWRGETSTLYMMQQRVEHDLYYIDNMSIMLDLQIIFLTIFSSKARQNAY
jgi:Undecaprenyl-phosphate glucose phosphotransferase